MSTGQRTVSPKVLLGTVHVQDILNQMYFRAPGFETTKMYLDIHCLPVCGISQHSKGWCITMCYYVA
ncbi:hypothetical protein I7I50_12582 [Histoplasma capsulatum G186AR]|uniref:Uncharacterized protein n=1 Tax=Ajellomyces capsulatus TaxID=5037 RepID=A0A8H7YCE2_AJECA|nr:hypothetical protein I7I52_11113 [Histoplasma capsulatum]QSS70826.1 hypothetical protein I7I50_12582 [Histoplasma capsulatum G186AR]